MKRKGWVEVMLILLNPVPQEVIQLHRTYSQVLTKSITGND